MDQNNNRAAVDRLAARGVKKGGLSAALTALTICITAALVAGLLMGGLGIRTAQLRPLARAQHAAYMNLEGGVMERMAADGRFAAASPYKMGQAVEQNGVLVTPCYFEADDPVLLTYELAEGRAPEGLHEAAADKAMLQALGAPAELGAEFTVHFLGGGAETFTVVGLTDYTAGGAQMSRFRLMLSRQYAEEGPQLAAEPWNLMARLAGGDELGGDGLEAALRAIGEEYGLAYQDVNPHDFYMNALTARPVELLGYILVGMAIALVSVLVIYSIFYLSVAQRVRQFGQLRTVGMTRRQLRRMVRREGLLLWALGWPVGFAAASLGVAVFGVQGGMSMKNLLLGAAASLLCTLGATLLAVRRPAKMASEVSPIEAVRYNEAASAPAGRRGTRSLTPWGLARIGFGRDRKKTALTLASLAVGGILFMAGATFVASWDPVAYARAGIYTDAEYTITFDYNSERSTLGGRSELQLKGLLGPEFQQKLLALPGVERLTAYRRVDAQFEWNGAGGQENIMVVSGEQAGVLARCLEQGTADYAALDGGVYVAQSGLVREYFGFTPEVGSTVTLHYNIGGPRQAELKILGVGDNRVRDLLPTAPFFLVTENTARQLFGGMDTTDCLAVTMQEHRCGEETDAMMEEFMAGYPQLDLDTFTEQLAESRYQWKIFQGVFLGLGGFAILFSFINLLNTLLSNLMARRQELAMLAALGMTRRQVARMLQYEGLCMAAVNLAATLALGTLAGMGLVRLMHLIGAEYMQFTFPWALLALYALVAAAAPAAITAACLHGFYKESLVERLRAAGG